MNLSGLFQYGNKNSVNQGNVVVSGNSNTQAIKNFVPGQTLQGEVVGINGNEIQIQIDADTVITARMEKNLNITLGQSMTFEVKNNSGLHMALRPLFENMAQEANVLKALEAAKLPATNELLRMVSTMMEQGMSIDKNSLQEMSRLVMTNPGASPENIVLLNNLKIGVTPENLEQFARYQNYEHQILSSVMDILSELSLNFDTMVSQGQESKAVELYTKILQLFAGNTEAGENKMPVALPEGNETSVQQGSLKEALHIETGNPEENVQALKSDSAEKTVFIPDSGEAITEDGLAAAYKNAVIKNTDALMSMMGEESVLSETLNGSERTMFSQMLGKLGFTEEQLLQIKNGNVDVKQLLQHIGQILSENGGHIKQADVAHLFASKEYNKLLNNEILKQWLLKPMEVAQKSSVEEFYGRLREQTARLTEALNQTVKDTPLGKNLQTMQNNIDFMNQINQVYHYIQLPLKMSGGNAHGDLYVYANKKSSLKEDGSVSALLHLDMEHVGTMDIYVTMKDKNVGTKFYLKDESTIDFIAGHIHMLDERLAKKGYSLNAEVTTLDEEKENKNVIENITSKDSKGKLLAQYAFDVRA